ncbi:MAG: SGNH/GDSL hydrolase family protein [Pyrinomonadaceae bacterium]|nr:SGNH/GDSL hydrolase family protein [Pyrinomonadaceae bacterium]
MLRLSLKRRLLYISIIYFSFIALLAGVEIGARLTLPHVSSLDLFVATSQQKAQVANAQQSGIFEGDPLLLWRLKPNLDDVVWDFTVVSTNAQNLRANHAIKAKAPGAMRIVCLGDSVTFGYRVPPVWPERPSDYDPEWLPYPMLLEQQLCAANPAREVEVISMAVPGYTSHQGLAWLQRDIIGLQPDLLIASFGWNDVSFSEVPDRKAIRTTSYAVALRWLISHSQAFAHTTKWLRSRNQGQTPAQSAKQWPVPRVSEQEYLGNMNEIVRLARERGAGVIVIAAPYRDGVTNPSEAELMARYRKLLRAEMERKRIPFLEVTELTEAAYPSNQGWFGELIHPNHLGHRLMAAELLELLSAERLATGLTVPTLTP